MALISYYSGIWIGEKALSEFVQTYVLKAYGLKDSIHINVEIFNINIKMINDDYLFSQSQFRIHPYDHISSCYEIKQLCLSGHISVYRNMTFVFPLLFGPSKQSSKAIAKLILFTKPVPIQY